MMHEWTDGRSAQYKSCHCMGDVAQSSSDFSYVTVRNYFETSHAKGPQDGAGANLKHKYAHVNYIYNRPQYLDLFARRLIGV